MKRRICVVTGSRADYGLLRLLMKEIGIASGLQLQLIVTGMHLSSTFGLSYREIEKDGFDIDRKIECLSDADTPIDIAGSMAKTLEGCAKAFEELKPDIILLLGDRFEIFSAATAALVSKIPIAHIHGGESTVGAYDEAFRHSITKMSQIHFVATEEYKNRVVQLGENPRNVYMVGGVGIDEIKEIGILKRDALEKVLGFKFKKRILLVTFHASTLENRPVDIQFRALLCALENREDTTIIFTMPNTDTGGLTIMKMIEDFVAKNNNSHAFKSLGRRVYLSCIAAADGVVGNSSSGIIEAPSFKVGTINVGMRQEGRVLASSVITCQPTEKEIRAAISKLYTHDFKSKLELTRNPYGEGGASKKIVRILQDLSLENIIQKRFYNLSPSNET
jgi:GDP/UDP-N,N'-diacetylbacillosamine 2-epimerase (hydrolysing)